MSRRAQITCSKHRSHRIGSWQVFTLSQGTEGRADSSLVVFRRKKLRWEAELGTGSEWEGAPRPIVSLSRSCLPNLYNIAHLCCRALKTTLPGIWGTKEQGRRSAAGAGVATGPCTWSERAPAPKGSQLRRHRQCDLSPGLPRLSFSHVARNRVRGLGAIKPCLPR
jgi:hypothetical protein